MQYRFNTNITKQFKRGFRKRYITIE